MTAFTMAVLKSEGAHGLSIRRMSRVRHDIDSGLRIGKPCSRRQRVFNYFSCVRVVRALHEPW
jgi:hypothetical protein